LSQVNDLYENLVQYKYFVFEKCGFFLNIERKIEGDEYTCLLTVFHIIVVEHDDVVDLVILVNPKKSLFEDTKEVIRIRKSKDRKHNGQKKKNEQRSIKHYTEN